jgi:hypothetical protein
VGYFLITGQTVFNARTLNELCQQHIDATPQTPSTRLGRTVSPELEHAILSCLEKSRAKRPQTARDLANMLEHITPLQPWTKNDAEAWWSRHERKQGAANVAPAAAAPEGQTRPPPSAPTGGTVIAAMEHTITLDGPPKPT